jgi:hypothetical protein
MRLQKFPTVFLAQLISLASGNMSDKSVRNKFERWILRQRPESRRAGGPESFTTVQVNKQAKLCVPFVSTKFGSAHGCVVRKHRVRSFILHYLTRHPC